MVARDGHGWSGTEGWNETSDEAVSWQLKVTGSACAWASAAGTSRSDVNRVIQLDWCTGMAFTRVGSDTQAADRAGARRPSAPRHSPDLSPFAFPAIHHCQRSSKVEYTR